MCRTGRCLWTKGQDRLARAVLGDVQPGVPHFQPAVPSLRGFGWSGRTRRGYDMEGLAEDMLGLLDALGLERVGLVGHDWGAHPGFRLCLRAPERFTGYLALNMSHPWPRHRAVLPNL
ncbi:alpha/beta fold hydrolase [Streptomyces sp. NPDC046197]|uniref:alpha/beta fold hydrolase n=1 Tax=Streptomyces sp. NPDC046197 TaxID=3154337 RepID=UPI0033EFF374